VQILNTFGVMVEAIYPAKINSFWNGDREVYNNKQGIVAQSFESLETYINAPLSYKRVMTCRQALSSGRFGFGGHFHRTAIELGQYNVRGFQIRFN